MLTKSQKTMILAMLEEEGAKPLVRIRERLNSANLGHYGVVAGKLRYDLLKWEMVKEENGLWCIAE